MSDSHMNHDQINIPDGDIFIHSGDFLGHGRINELIIFNEWLKTLPHKHKFIVPGNHDWVFFDHEATARDTLTEAICLIDESIEIESLKIYGTPWMPKFYDWAFMKSEKDLIPIYEKIPNNLDILITHTPPYDILDKNMRGHPCGSQSLHDAVMKKAPRAHIFGHIHESSGIMKLKNTTFYNAAVLNDYYAPVFECKEFEL